MSARRRPSLVATVVLTAVWLLLWERVSLFLVVTGVLLALLVFLVFPLAPIERSGRIRPGALAVLLGRLAADVIRSSIRVVALAFSRREPRSAIIRVRLRTRSDLVLTMTAELVSLTPGTIVLEVRRAEHTLYLHVLDMVEPAELQQAAQDVLDAEARVLRAFGSAEEISSLDAEAPRADGAGRTSRTTGGRR